MTAVDTERGTGLGIHAVYPSLIYEIHLMSDYFTAFGDAWTSCVHLAWYRDRLKPRPVGMVRQQAADDARRVRDASRPHIFRVHRLRIGSPMVITFAVEGGIVAVGVYATFLAARVLRSPESVGAWLPRVVAGWHRGMYEAEMRRYERHVRSRNDDDDDFEEWPLKPDELPTEQDIRQLPDVRGLMKVSNQLIDLRMQPDEVSVIGADETPEDLAVADDFDQS